VGTTEKVVRFIVDFDFESIPAKGNEQIKASIIDSVGVALFRLHRAGRKHSHQVR
jgi:hypothetical protein